MTSKRKFTRARAEARRLGRSAGTDAASWIFDGNTTRMTYAHMLRGIIDGDPMVMDSVREPSLSGEYSDDYSERDLLQDLDMEDATPEEQDELAAEYIGTARDSFWCEVERSARAAIMPKMRGGRYYIAYFGDGYPGSRDCTPEAYTSLKDVRTGFEDYARAVGRDYYDPYGTANGSVYAAEGEDMWLEALRFDGTGVPFDYPSYTIGYGPRGGVVLQPC